MRAQVAVRKTPWQETKEHEGAKQCKDASVAEAERRGALTVDADGLMDPMERDFADGAIVPDALDAE
jgi:hypothetical protein